MILVAYRLVQEQMRDTSQSLAILTHRERMSKMIGREKLARDIAIVGSIEYHRKWCIQGTRDEYLLLDEHIDRTMFAVKEYADHSNQITAQERYALLLFHDRVDELFDAIPWNDPDVSIEEIVERNEAMKQIRQAANDCLRKLGVEYSTEELLAD